MDRPKRIKPPLPDKEGKLALCDNCVFVLNSRKQETRHTLDVSSASSPTPTWGLKVECDQLGAAEPHRKRVIVGRVQPLSSGINSGKLPLVVLQETLPFAAGRKLLRLGLGEGRHVLVTGSLRPNLWTQQHSPSKTEGKKESGRTGGCSLVLTVLVEGDGSAVDHQVGQFHCNLLPPLHLLLLLHLSSWRRDGQRRVI